MSFSQGHEPLLHLPGSAREMFLRSMTTSMIVAERLGLGWARVNLTKVSGQKAR